MIRPLLALPIVAMFGAAARADSPPPPETWSAAELADLATAHAAKGERGLAILDLERARLLSPRDPVLATSLATARESAGIAQAEPSRLDRALGMLGSDDWSWLVLAGGVLAGTGAVASAWGFRRRLARPLAVAGVLTCGLAAIAMVQVAPSPARAIVVDGAVAKLSPFDASEPAFTAPAGEAVQIEQARGDYLYVRDGDRAGWMPKAAVETVVVADRAGART
jgi:hypothetical protein